MANKGLRNPFVRKVVNRHTNVVSHGYIVLLSCGNVFTSRSKDKFAVEIVQSIFHEGLEFVVSIDGINLESSLVVEPVDLVKSRIKLRGCPVCQGD